ncbi:MAG: TssQ family T6SS-associated lipoprotein [Sulfuricella denitrificans]|nr:TssQ family T6SS-associated lipoprotein [Sulfuricella denitrificans]
MLKTYLIVLPLISLVLLTSACSNTSPGKIPLLPQEETPVPKKVEEPADKPSPSAVRKSEQSLNLGVRSYEDGNYKLAAGHFQNALADDSLSASERVTAHKFLAFIYCVSGEKLACRGEFKKVLTLNPKFELSAGEAGHPLWGPVFREVQAETSVKKQRKR